MAAENKAANKVTEVKGKVKEGVGGATGDGLTFLPGWR